jgi:tRNA A-37 threonylcarbamoyl transferase component Bud32
MSLQTNEMFPVLKDVCATLHDGAALYAQFERNCDTAAEQRGQNEYDTSDEGELEADDLLDNFEHSSIAENHSAADATDSSAYEKNRHLTAKQQRQQQQQQQQQAQVVRPQRQQQPQQQQPQQQPRPKTVVGGEDDRLLESAQVFMREQRVDTTTTMTRTGQDNNTVIHIDSAVPQFEYARIEFEQQIGKGTYSIVHSALYCGYRIAAKVLNVPVPENAVAREKLLLEFRLMAMLRHPNIVQLMGISCTPSRNHLVVCTELCSRGSLKENLDTVSDMTLRIKFAKHTIAGLQWMHSNNIVHRDLKPANLLVREDYSVVIADFGLSLYIGATPAERPVSRHFKGCALRCCYCI